MGTKREKRIRHGELITQAWNPSYQEDIAGSIEVEQEDGTMDTYDLRSLRIDQQLAQMIKGESDGMTRLRVYTMDDIRIISSIDNTKHGRLMHVSVSRPDRLPSWPEMIAIKRKFYPEDVAAVMLAPEKEAYVNMHIFTLHFWQLPEKWSIG